MRVKGFSACVEAKVIWGFLERISERAVPRRDQRGKKRGMTQNV